MSTATEKNTKVPKYVQLADQLRQQILDGELPPHGPLLTFTEMKARFGATQWTVEKAHAILEEDGLIRRESSRGLFVNDPALRARNDFVAFMDEELGREVPYHQEIQRGLRSQAEADGKSVTLVSNPAAFKHWKSMDGIIFDKFGPFRQSEFGPYMPKNLPVVRLHYEDDDVSSVVADDEAGVTMAVQHLVDLGHRRIGFLLRGPDAYGPGFPSTTKLRQLAYCRAMEANGVVTEPAWTHFYLTDHKDFAESDYEETCRWLRTGWRDLKLTAMLAQNDYAAMGMIRAFEENGIRVPEDVSVVGFDGVDYRVSPTLQLSTVLVPLREIGMTAMKLLTAHINQPSRPPQIVKLPVKFQPGGTTAAPRRG